ncbi:MAG: hypothetical protein AAB558_00815 [Patescibacteria group bacterium]
MKKEFIQPVADLLESSGLPAQDQLDVARFFARAEDHLIGWFLHYVKVEPTWLTALSQNLRAKKSLVEFTTHLTPQDIWKKEQAFFDTQDRGGPTAAGAAA